MIRLAGLYTESRGPHSYWLNKAKEGAGTAEGVIQGSGDAHLNMLHYEDAASAVVALAQSSGELYFRDNCAIDLKCSLHIAD